MPNGAQISFEATAHINLPCISPDATLIHFFPDLAQHSLLSIGQLCDNGCEATFDHENVTITYNKVPILSGTRNDQTGLWQLPVPIHPPQYYANQINAPTKLPQLVAWAHAALFSPAISTLCKALQLNFIHGFPGLTLQSLNAYPPASSATVKGYLDQKRKNQHPTNKVIESLPYLNTEIDTDAFPDPLTQGQTHHIYAATIATTPTGQVYSDQTGRLPFSSSSGATQLFVLYDYDSNSIHAIPMNNKSSDSIINAYKTVHDQLVRAGLRPKLQRLDNECSLELQAYLEEQQVTIQLVPPGIHRANAAERAIRTFKNHFVAGMATVDPEFPTHLWDRLLPQALITMNIMRASRINPRLSAYAQVFGQFDYQQHPLAPPGTHAFVHVKPDNRGSWAPHALDAWYLGPALLHYRCYRVWMWDSKHERISDTVTWLPKTVQLPQMSPIETIIKCTNQITEALTQLRTIAPSNDLSDHNKDSLHHLQAFHDILNNVQQHPSNEPNPPREQRVILEETPANNPTLQPTTYLSNAPAADNNYPRRSEREHKPTQRLIESSNAAIIDTINSAINIDTGKLTEYRQLLKSTQGPLWEKAACEEWARLAQGLPSKNIPESEGTNTIRFISHTDLPTNAKPTYPRIVVADRPNKAKPIRVRVTVGGNLINSTDDVSTKTSDIATVKILLNSTISTPGAKFMTVDIKDFYLNTPMDTPEYMRVPIKLFPPAIIQHYHLIALAHNDNINVEIRKGMYGLPQADRLANDELVQHLAQHGYEQSPHTHGLFHHVTRPIAFCLVVDDFGVKYTGHHNAQHLIDTLQLKYQITTDWNGEKYIGLLLHWDYIQQTVDISMPEYINKALERFEHPMPQKPQDSPHAWLKPQYGATQQLTADINTSPPLTPNEITTLQQIIGVLLYYTRAVDSTMLVALGTLAAHQTQVTQNTMITAKRLLDYAATHSNATVRFHRSDMIMHVHSDASYLSETQARSRAGGIAFLDEDTLQPHINGAIHVHSSILKNVVSSAAVAEVAALFHNSQDACPLRQTLLFLGHEQPATPITTDNACAHGIMNKTVKQKRSKAMDMRYYWLRDRVRQDQFRIYWAPGSQNLADYFTKHHPAQQHRDVRNTYLHPPTNGQ